MELRGGIIGAFHAIAGGLPTLMCHARRIISDAIWERYAPYLPGRVPGAWGGSAPKYDNGTVLEAVLWIAGAAW